MPKRAPSLCRCGTIRVDGVCPRCPPKKDKKEVRRTDVREQRGSRHERGYTYRWVKYRKWFLARNPKCIECEKKGLYRSSTVVDHVVPHRGNTKLFWDYANHQALCEGCHNEKTARGE